MNRSLIWRRDAAFALVLLFPLSVSAVCTTSGNETICDQTLNYRVQSGNIWGPNNERPPDTTFRLLSDSWNLRETVGDSKGVDGFGTFGGYLSVGTTGNLGFYVGIEGIRGGSYDLNIDTTAKLVAPAADTFVPGREVAIKFESSQLPSTDMNVSGRLLSGNVSLWGELGLNASAGAQLCFFDCASVSLPSIGFDSFGDGGFPLPPGTSFSEGRARQLIAQLPVERDSVVAGPLFDRFGALVQGACPPQQIEIKEFSPIFDKSGLNGCFGPPQLATSADLTNEFGRIKLTATRFHTFLDADLDLDFWASKIKGVPPLSYQRALSKGPITLASAFVDGLDVDINSKLSLRQTLTFTGQQEATLRFSSPIEYRVWTFFATGGFIIHSSGTGTEVTLRPGQELRFVAPSEQISVTTEYALDQRFSNDSELVYEVGTVQRILEAGLNIDAKAIGQAPFRVCKPWPNFSCWTPTIWSPSFGFNLGPLKTFSQPIRVQRDSKFFDANRPPWQIPQLAGQPGPSLLINPDMPPSLVLNVPEPAIFNEGETIKVDTFGSSDEEGTPFTPELAVFEVFTERPTSSPLQLTQSAPTGQGEYEFSFSVDDDAEYYMRLAARDGATNASSSSLVENFIVRNVAPAVTVNDQTVSEGVELVLPIEVLDPGVKDSQTITVNWGDGSRVERYWSQSGGTLALNQPHVYADDGIYTVDVCSTDKDAATSCDAATITVTNATPTIDDVGSIENTTINADTGELEVDLQVAVFFSDLATADTHTARLVWSDAEPVAPLTVRQFPSGPPGRVGGQTAEASASLQRTFADPGTVTSEVCVTDDDGGEICSAGPSVTAVESDLSVAVESNTSPVPLGERWPVTYRVTNNGSDPVDEIVLTGLLATDNDGKQQTTLASAQLGSDSALSTDILPADLASQEADLQYGFAVDVAGETMVVGAINGDKDLANPANEGAAFVFNRVNGEWVANGSLTGSSSVTGDEFGRAVAVSEDGSLIAVGAPLARRSNSFSSSGRGEVYVYRRNENGTPNDPSDDTWTEEERLAPAGLSEFAGMGFSVAVADDLLVVGAPFQLDVSNNFSTGMVLIYRFDGTGWNEESRIFHDDPSTGQLLGSNIAVANGRIISGGSDGGDVTSDGSELAVIEETSPGTWEVTQTILDISVLPSQANAFLGSGGLAADGDDLLVSSWAFSGAAGVVVYRHDGTEYVQQSLITLPTDDAGGISIDGDFAAVGILNNRPLPRAGSVITLERGLNGWAVSGQLLPPPNELSDTFAQLASSRDNVEPDNRVAVSGRTVFVGSPDATRAGKSVGTVYSMQSCEQRPTGTVICGVGTLGAGESRLVEIVSRVGCSVGEPVALSSSTSVLGDALESAVNDNRVDVQTTTAAQNNSCGIDFTPPLVEATLSGVLGNEDWFVSDVDVTWSAIDLESTIDSTNGCEPSTLSTDSAGADLTCQATNSENLTTVAQARVRRDATPPLIEAQVTSGTPGTNGWYQSAVVLDYICSDPAPGSGLATCEPQNSIAAEGITNGVIGRAADIAGNSSEQVSEIKIDLTDPLITPARTDGNASGWNKDAVSVSFECADAVSGISTCSADVVVTGEGAGQSVAGTAVDQSGRSRSVTLTDINIDLTAPTVAESFDISPNAQGWYLQIPTVSFTCEDDLSGVVACPESVSFSEGADLSVTVDSSDLAGNVLSFVSTPVNVDLTAPDISATITPAANADGRRSAPVTVSFTCFDALSGVDSCPGDVVLETIGLAQTVEAEATDIAGNRTEIVVEDINVGNPELLMLQADQTVFEGETIGPLLAQVPAAALTDGQAFIDWGDGNTQSVGLEIADGVGAVNAPYAFADEGSYTVTVTVKPDLGDALVGSFAVTAKNAAPAFDSLSFAAGTGAKGATPSTTIVLGQTLATEFFFTDPGSLDTHTVSIDWGDGSPIQTTIPSTTPLGPPSPGAVRGTVVLAHEYMAAGDYSGEVCVTDNSDAETCVIFTVRVESRPARPTQCSATLGEPIGLDDGTEVPLTGALLTPDAEIVNVFWQDADEVFPFDDPSNLNPMVTLPSLADGPHNLGVTMTLNAEFPDGSNSTCVASACGIVQPDGSVVACQLGAPSAPVPVNLLRPMTAVMIALLFLLIAGISLKGGPVRLSRER